jgi:hypothetical protein
MSTQPWGLEWAAQGSDSTEGRRSGRNMEGREAVGVFIAAGGLKP